MIDLLMTYNQATAQFDSLDLFICLFQLQLTFKIFSIALDFQYCFILVSGGQFNNKTFI